MNRSVMIFIFLFACVLRSFTQTTTSLADQLANNTSGCVGSIYGCRMAFPAMTDNQPVAAGSVILTPTFNPIPNNISGPQGFPTPDLQNHYSNMVSIPPSSLMPYTPTIPPTRLFVHFLPWFDSSYPGDHVDPGYDSNNIDVVLKQLADMQARGFGGLIIDWNGGPNQCRSDASGDTFAAPCIQKFITQDNVVAKVRDNAAVSPLNLSFAIMEDQHALDRGETCGSGSGFEYGAANQLLAPKCVLNKLKADLQYLDLQYFPNTYPYYTLTNPVLFTFIDESEEVTSNHPWFQQCTSVCTVAPGDTCTSASNCWVRVWTNVRAYANTLLNPPKIVFLNSGGFSQSHVVSNGSIAWVHPNGCNRAGGENISNNTQRDWRQNFGYVPDHRGGPPDCQGDLVDNYLDGFQDYLDEFYKIGRCIYQGGACQIGDIAVASIFKGFDNFRAPWVDNGNPNSGKSKVMTQKCGLLWRDSWREFGMGTPPWFDGPPNHEITAIQVATWNDYDEGTEIETGIDNCLNVDRSGQIPANMNGSILQWPITFSDVGNDTTIAQFQVFDSSASDPNGNTLVLVASGIDHAQRQIDVSTLSLDCGSRLLYVKAVGLPSVINRMSNAVPYDSFGCNTIMRLSTTTLTWSAQRVGTQSSLQTLNITNIGMATLNIRAISTVGDFHVSHNCPSSLPTGQSCTASVVFAPRVAGSRSGGLVIHASNAPSNPRRIALNGTGIL